MEKQWKTEGPASCDCSLHSSSNKKLIGLSGSPGWRLPKLCLEQAVSWLQGKQIKANRDVTQSQASKVPARNLLVPRREWSFPEAKEQLNWQEQWTWSSAEFCKMYWKPCIGKKSYQVFIFKRDDLRIFLSACNKTLPLTSLSCSFVKPQKVQTCKNMVL